LSSHAQGGEEGWGGEGRNKKKGNNMKKGKVTVKRSMGEGESALDYLRWNLTKYI